MPTCRRLDSGKGCRYWCKPSWIFCHNYFDGYCRNDVADCQCENGWHITEKGYRNKRITEQFSAPRTGSKHRKSKRTAQSEVPSTDDEQEVKKYKRDPRLEIYLARFNYKPDEMPDRREIEEVFFKTTSCFLDTSHREQIPASEFSYEEYSEAFQYIIEIITNGAPE